MIMSPGSLLTSLANRLMTYSAGASVWPVDHQGEPGLGHLLLAYPIMVAMWSDFRTLTPHAAMT
jgi:hypothetical protein